MFSNLSLQTKWLCIGLAAILCALGFSGGIYYAQSKAQTRLNNALEVRTEPLQRQINELRTEQDKLIQYLISIETSVHEMSSKINDLDTKSGEISNENTSDVSSVSSTDSEVDSFVREYQKQKVLPPPAQPSYPAPALAPTATPSTWYNQYVNPPPTPSPYAYRAPSIAENGSYDGEISDATGRPKTVYVEGYTRRDGTYVRSHYKSSPKK